MGQSTGLESDKPSFKAQSSHAVTWGKLNPYEPQFICSVSLLCRSSAEKLASSFYSSDIGDGGGQPLWDHLPHGRVMRPQSWPGNDDVHYSSLGCYPVLPFPTLLGWRISSLSWPVSSGDSPQTSVLPGSHPNAVYTAKRPSVVFEGLS